MPLASLRRHLIVLALCAINAVPAAAQSAQRWSVQASLLSTNQDVNGSAISGVGFEGQFRLTPSQWSYGLGVQFSTHERSAESLTLTGVFLEPRYAIDIGSDRWSPYLAGRLAFLHQSSTLLVGIVTSDFASTGLAFGGGAGVLYALSARTSLDLGAAIVRQSFSEASNDLATVRFSPFLGYVAKLSISIGL